VRLRLICLASFLYDLPTFVALSVIPMRAVDMKASSTTVALLQTASTAVYVVTSLVVGRLADRWPKAVLARIGCTGGIAACFLIGWVDSLPGLFASAVLLGLGSSVFWPAVQGAIGSETEPARMEAALAFFNFMWSLGKSAGYVMAGWLVERHGHALAMWVAAGAAAPIVLFYPWGEGRRAAVLYEAATPDRVRFRTMGYAANFAAFGLGTAFQNQFYKFLEGTQQEVMFGRKVFYGLLLGAMYGVQTLSFLVLRNGSWWTYRRGPLYAAQGAVAVAAAALPFAGSDAAWLGLAAVIGSGLGFCYASSIYYSLHGPAEHGKYAGLHEAVLGTGSFLIPLGGGALADLTGDLRVPYLLAAAVVLASVAFQERFYRTRSSS
jgi:MFS family permease